jgi:hypothetical protein
MSTAAEAKSPVPVEVDERAQEFSDLEKSIAKLKLELQSSQKELAAKEAALIELVRSFGGPHSTKSKILHGIVWEMMATFAQYTTQDAAAVERFRLALVNAKKGCLLKKLFERDVRWTMKSGAGQILQAENLSPRLKADLLGLLLLCSTTQDKKPSLDVREKKKKSATA